MQEEKTIIEEQELQTQTADATDTTTEETATEDTKTLTLEEQLAKAQSEIEELKDKYLRQVAEFDNFRKRTLKEKTDLILNGGEKVITAFLPILDDLERAQQNMQKSDDIVALREGVDLILGKLSKVLVSQGLQKMETEGVLFDTDFHEAIALIPIDDETQKGHIIDCVQAGYLFNEKVVRHAKVAVGQ